MPRQTKKEQDFIAAARKRFEAAASDEKALREEALTDLKYVAGDQWDPKIKQDRERAGRPALVFPRCHTFVQQVANEARQNKPQIKFAPDDDSADEDTAEVCEGLARWIQYSSDAQIAYETSVEYSAGGSFGYYRFLTEENDDGEQDLKIVPVLDPFAVYGILVPSCFGREPKFGFVIEDIPKDEFKDLYPKSAITLDAGFDDGGIKSGWIGTDTVRVAEYWYCEQKDVEGKRKPQTVVHFCKMTWAEELPDSRTTWMGYCIPIIPVLGKQMIINGRPLLFSVVRPQRGAQQMINYSKTRIAETLSTAPISPYIVAAGQIKQGDKKWDTMNTNVYPYLEYNLIDLQGKPAPPPQRQTFEPPIQAYSAFVAQEIDDMKATTGIFDASLGQKSNETSGQAIVRRQQQSNMTTMHYMDNLERAFKKGGLIMEDLFPKLYDTERMIRILGEDEAPKVVKINAPYDANGQTKHHKVGGEGAGKYRAIVTMGRAFSTKRQESFDMMSQVLQGNPQLMPMIGDIMFRNSDMAGADQLAERFKKMLPPNLQDQDQSDPETQLHQAQGQLQQLTQAHQALNAYAQKLEQEKQGKVIETQGRVQIEQFKAQKEYELKALQITAQRDIAEITTKAQDLRERMKLDASLDEALHVSAHEVGMQAHQQAHERDMAEKQAAIASEAAAQDHSQTLEAQQQAAASAEGNEQ